MNVTVVPATINDARSVAEILFDVRLRCMPYAPLVHDAQTTRTWVREHLIASRGVTVARIDETAVGLIACSHGEDCSWITQMAVSPAFIGCGIGTQLLLHALGTLPPPIRLYTFQANHGARRFYERHGFCALAFTDGSGNEERCPDILYERLCGWIAEGNGDALLAFGRKCLPWRRADCAPLHDAT